MNIEQALRTQLAATFSSLNSVAAANAFPAPRTLSETLEKLAPRGNFGDKDQSGLCIVFCNGRRRYVAS